METSTGVPLCGATYWIVASRRSSNAASNTLYNELRSLMYLFLWASARGIDIEHRLREGVFLSLSEIIDLANVCGRFIDGILIEVEARRSNLVVFDKAQSVRKLRVKKNGTLPSASSGEKYNRLSAIYSYLSFTTSDCMSALQHWPKRRDVYERARATFLQTLDKYRDDAQPKRRKSLGGRNGLEEDQLALLKKIIRPEDPGNPFHPSVRFRNYVMFILYIALGMRRGELLVVKVSDVVFGTDGSLTIHRRPDDPKEKRRYKPSVKTNARMLPLDEARTKLVHDWVIHHRAKIPGARTHNFLFVDMSYGKALSLSSVNKMFRKVREAVPGLPQDLTPHVLRHTWNDEYTDSMDKKGVPAEEQSQARSLAMGWSSESSAEFYQRRKREIRANKHLKDIQAEFDIILPEGHK